VPPLFLEDGTIIDGLDNIVAWAAANPRCVEAGPYR